MQEPVGARYQLEESQSQRELGDDVLYKIFSKLKKKTLSVNYVTDAYVIDGIKAGVKPAHLRPLGKIQGKRNPYVGCILTHTRQKSMN